MDINNNTIIKANKPAESKYLNVSTPWISVNEVNAGILEKYRYTGLTVNVGGNEYWYKLGIDDSDLVLKQTGGGGGDRNNRYSKQIVYSGITLTTDSSYVILVSGSSAVTIYLPAVPEDGMAFIIKDISGNALNNNITIDGNGLNLEINGSATINTNYGALEFMYDSTAQWIILSFVN